MCGFCTASEAPDPCGKDHLGSIQTEFTTIAALIPDNTSTLETISIGGTRDETLENVGDQDWFRIDLTEGDTVQIDLFGLDHDNNNGLGELLDPFVRIHDASGNLLAENDDIVLGVQRDSRLVYQATETGTFYIEVDSYLSSYIGDYRLQVSATTPPPPTSPLDAIQTNFTLNINDPVLVYFAQAGDTYAYNGDTYTATGVNTYEQSQLFSVFEGVEEFINVDFQITTNRNAADLEWATDTLPSTSGGTLLGFFFFPSSNGNGGYGILNNNSGNFPSWNSSPGGTLDTGGFMYGVAVHELGHGLGLAHAHDSGAGSDVMQGVSSSSSRGSFGLNSSPFTTMSYNEGWADNPAGLANSVASTGHGASFGALDIAALQNMYGANTAHASGDDVYDLFDSNTPGSGAGYYATWDTGGLDKFRYTGSKDAVIDLRDATLLYEDGGGGFMSHVDGVIAGRTIANGVTIENATSGSGDDTLTGNTADNVLISGIGNDMLNGGAGNDTLLGEEGSDTLDGGDGADLFVFGLDDAVGDVIADYTDEDVIIFTGTSTVQDITVSGADVMAPGVLLKDAASQMVTVLSQSSQTPLASATDILDGTLEGSPPETDFSLARYDFGNIESWDSYTNKYNDAGALTNRTYVYDNGQVSETIFVDGSRTQLVVSETDGDVRTTTYDADGRRDTFRFEDQSETRTWSNYTNQYDDDGALTDRAYIFDNGVLSETTYVDGTRTQLAVTAIDGEVRTTTYVENLKTQLVITETDGDVRTTTYDADGRRDTFRFEDLSETRTWSNYTNQYDDTDAITSQTRSFDDGRVILTEYEDGEVRTTTYVDNLKTQLVVTETDGDVRTTTYDTDGRRDTFRFEDQSETRTWSNYTNHYDDMGNITSRTRVLDDGRIFLTEYEDDQPTITIEIMPEF